MSEKDGRSGDPIGPPLRPPGPSEAERLALARRRGVLDAVDADTERDAAAGWRCVDVPDAVRECVPGAGVSCVSNEGVIGEGMPGPLVALGVRMRAEGRRTRPEREREGVRESRDAEGDDACD
jgi:hypothetical protein